MVQFPAKNVANLFALVTPAAPYQPILSSAPHDWTISITYDGGGLSNPGAIALDASDNVWVANTTANSLSEFNSHGVALSGPQGTNHPTGPNGQLLNGFVGGGLSYPVGLAVDLSGNVWVANCGDGCPTPTGNGNVSEFDQNGVPVSPATGYSLGTLTYSSSVAIDGNNDVWVGNDFSNTVVELSNNGAQLSSPAGYATGTLDGPFAMAFDSKNYLWLANSLGATVTKIDQSGAEQPNSPYTAVSLSNPIAIAVDPGNNVWLANPSNNSLTELNNSGIASSTSTYTGGGIHNPQAIAIDSVGQVWILNSNNSLSEISGINANLSPASGFQPDGLATPAGIAIDRAGNLWITNSAANSVTEVIGVARPVMTPLAVAIQSNPTPVGATALCKDGDYSFSATRSGTCSHNGGVQEWLAL